MKPVLIKLVFKTDEELDMLNSTKAANLTRYEDAISMELELEELIKTHICHCAFGLAHK